MSETPTDQQIIDDMKELKELYRIVKTKPESAEQKELMEVQRKNYILRECLSDNDSEISDNSPKTSK